MGKEHKEYTWNLIAKKLAGEASPEELRELEMLLRNNPDLHYPMQTITDLWEHSPSHNPGDIQKAEKAFSEHVDRMERLHIDFHPTNNSPTYEELFPTRKRYGGRTALLLTPAIAILIGLVWYF